MKHHVKELFNAAELHVDVEPSPFGKNESCKNDHQRHPDLIIHNQKEEAPVLQLVFKIANPFSQVVTQTNSKKKK